MKLFFIAKFVLILLLPVSSFADAVVKGIFRLDDGHFALDVNESTQRLMVIPTDLQVRSRLSCLKDGDFLSGTATKVNQTHAVFRSIDYVGLRDLFGTWRGGSEVFRFTDFLNFYYWDLNPDSSKYGGPHTYHYALSPYGNDPEECLWKIFIIDNIGVTLGSVTWMPDDRLQIQIYDTDTGEITSTKVLSRCVESPLF